MVRITAHQCAVDDSQNWKNIRGLPSVQRVVVSRWGRKEATMHKAYLDGPVLIHGITGQIYRDGQCLSSVDMRIEP